MADFDEDYIFPYVDMEEEELVDLYKNDGNGMQSLYSNYGNLNLRTFDDTEHKPYEVKNEIDREHSRRQTGSNMEQSGIQTLRHYVTSALQGHVGGRDLTVSEANVLICQIALSRLQAQ